MKRNDKTLIVEYIKLKMYVLVNVSLLCLYPCVTVSVSYPCLVYIFVLLRSLTRYQSPNFSFWYTGAKPRWFMKQGRVNTVIKFHHKQKTWCHNNLSKNKRTTCMISRRRYSTSGAISKATSEDKLLIPIHCAMTSIFSLGIILILFLQYLTYWGPEITHTS